MYNVILARQLRLAVVTNVFEQGLLDEKAARELLARPLSPGDNGTIYDDSALLGDHDGLEKIAGSAPSPEPKDKPFRPFLSLAQTDQDWIDSQNWDTSPPLFEPVVERRNMTIRVKEEIPVYEVDGKETEPGGRFIARIYIQSHWQCDTWIILAVSGVEYVVAAADLLAAIANARNVNR